jgi:hypothetical protein
MMCRSCHVRLCQILAPWQVFIGGFGDSTLGPEQRHQVVSRAAGSGPGCRSLILRFWFEILNDIDLIHPQVRLEMSPDSTRQTLSIVRQRRVGEGTLCKAPTLVTRPSSPKRTKRISQPVRFVSGVPYMADRDTLLGLSEISVWIHCFGDADIQRGPAIAIQNIHVSVLGKKKLCHCTLCHMPSM